MVNSVFRYAYCSVYEIYPQSETPHLTKIADLDSDSSEGPADVLLPDIVIWYSFLDDWVVFWIWDYRLNHSVSFSVDVDVLNSDIDSEVYFILSTALKLDSDLFVGR